MNQPLVSVLVTSYNRAKYIQFAIESILNQSYQNYEILISDNCSTDDTMEILKKYEGNSKIRIYRTEKNIGQFPNRNWIASLANGKYLKYVDSDDFIYPTGLEVLVNMMEANPKADWGLCSLVQVKEQPYPILLSPHDAYWHNFFGYGLFHKAPLSSIIKKEVFEKSGGFNPGKMVGDYEMWLRLAQKYPVLLMPDGIVWYREHADQELVYVKNYSHIYQKIKIFYLTHPQCPLTQEEVRKVFSSENKKLIKQLLKSIFKLDKNQALMNYHQLRLNRNPTHTAYPIH
jgi:glycosyltransferase involved in cell wall biosynthesis